MESGLGALKLLLPQIPALTGTAILHTLGRTPTSSKWDLRTELTIQVLRDWMGADKKPVRALEHIVPFRANSQTAESLPRRSLGYERSLTVWTCFDGAMSLSSGLWNAEWDIG